MQEKTPEVESLESLTKAGNPSEELQMLENRISVKEAHEASPESLEQGNRERLVAEELEAYKQAQPEAVLTNDFQIKVHEIQETILHMSAEHGRQVEEIAVIMQEKGIKNALTILERIDNPHIADDFHRFLVQYVAEGLQVKGLKEGTRLFRAVHKTLYEVTLPEVDPDQAGGFRELVTSMQQFYEGLMTSGKGNIGEFSLSFELALSRYSDEIVFYVAVPQHARQVFEKQLLGAFPTASLTEHREDYNPFHHAGATASSMAKLAEPVIFPIRSYEAFEQDPLKTMLNVFSRLDRDDEGAAIQLLFAPPSHIDAETKEFQEMEKRLRDGEKVEEATASTARRMVRGFRSVASEIIKGTAKSTTPKEEDVDTEAIAAIEEKMSAPIVGTNIRLIASATSKERAREILDLIQSSFNQFAKPQGNSIEFKRMYNKDLDAAIHRFSFRLYEPSYEIPLNLKELTTIFHFPVTNAHSAQLKQSDLKSAPPPANMDPEGVVLGINNYRGTDTTVTMGSEDRVRHMYVIGQTGTGKSVLLQNMVAQDIRNGHGVCYMDPHGTDLIDILNAVPEERMKDVIWFDPSDMTRPMGLNMLEYDPAKLEQKAFVVNEMLSIFNKLFDMKVAGGPMFEQYFRNATKLVIEDPATGSTLIDVSRVFADPAFRELKLSRCKDPLVVQFWREIAQKAGGESSLANMVPYINSKFDVFLSNDVMRLIIAQQQSAFNFRELMDNRKILLVNLAKGKLGDINANLLGLILVGKILMAALSRVDSVGQKLPDFYLYIDEFQNVTTDSISAILSEARKYRLSLNVAHQYISQLDEGIRDAVFGNVGSMAVFRVGAEDAQFLESQFAPTYEAREIMKIPNWNAYMKILVNGLPAKPFNIKTMAPPEVNPEVGARIKEYSQATHGVSREEVEAVIAKKYASQKKAPAPAAPQAGPRPQVRPSARVMRSQPIQQPQPMQAMPRQQVPSAPVSQAAPMPHNTPPHTFMGPPATGSQPAPSVTQPIQATPQITKAPKQFTEQNRGSSENPNPGQVPAPTPPPQVAAFSPSPASGPAPAPIQAEPAVAVPTPAPGVPRYGFHDTQSADSIHGMQQAPPRVENTAPPPPPTSQP